MTIEFGTTSWAAATGGQLSNAARSSETLRAIGAQLAAQAARFGRALGLTTKGFELAVSELALPTERLAQEALRALQACPKWIVDHSLRTYAFGLVLAKRDGLQPDALILFLASALHDLGLATDEGEACFAHRGAELARRVCLGGGASADLAAVVADAICQHLNVTPGRGLEAQLLREGAGYDVIGSRFDDLGHHTRQAIVEQWPRADFAKQIAARLEFEARAHPGTRTGHLCSRLQFPRLVAAADWRFINAASSKP